MIPIRMCINCKNRYPQKDLIRLQCEKNVIISYTGKGRSFYICNNCLEDKKLFKSFQRVCKNKNIEIKAKLNKKEYT
jgi:predicted RNA-binding protein YlxR (DUF448 family)